MNKPKIADTKPIAVELEKDKKYYWCTCGLSSNQPFCDGSHAGSGFEPQAFTAQQDGKAFLCQCKRSANPPFCDGSHNAITQEELDADQGLDTIWYKVAGLDELKDDEVRSVQAGSKTIALTFHQSQYGALDNACPHQGGPLGEGGIECDESGECWLRCPWHGWDFHPLSGKSPGGFGDGVDTYPVEVRDDGVYVQVKEHRERTRTISDVMVETMVNWGVTHVFGMVGHSNLGLADAIREQEDAGNLTYIGIRHEGAASFACSGFAKLSGKPAACLSIAGPGATNLMTGLWDAKVDRAPVLALTGQVNTQVFGPGAFQEIDLASAFQAVSRFSQTVLPGSRHAELMTLALKHAIVERDVAHLIFPDEVQVFAAADDAQSSSPDGRLAAQQISPANDSLGMALEKIAASQRPAIIVGYGAREAMADVLALAERLSAPVLTTFKAKGQVSDRHPLAAGVLGRSGTPIASGCMNEADLLIVFGASFANHTGITEHKPIIQVDFEQMALGKFHPVDVPVWGEVGVTARRLLNDLPAMHSTVDQRAEVAGRWDAWREEKTRRAARNNDHGLNSATVFDALSAACPEDAVIAVDVGNNTYSFGRYFECTNQTVLMSGYLGSIGFGFPAAMGAWAATQTVEAHKGRPVISISGDGGFGQYLAEFTTAVKYGMNLTHILLNNSELGKISKEQRAGNWQVWQTSLHNPDFAEFANSCGGLGIRVDTKDQLDEAIRKALAFDGPALVEIKTDAELI
ncbi:thiamine pyrophosphate-dependent enzyme [Vibrio alfacsensis]|jgi:thiamine pyrophosphate-dependent acetolactate synthase large subunit-like protein/CDGSH-type Zn-finger protein/nitrite reductase/ring-hydroxylating ferredoxin subunit|uniref:thiamine pyrophosphate-dependent enzyme n=1 Tax=Vibrio TaxID=662 RepID=UPI0040680E9E